MRIGFVGIGNMGAPMVRCLAQAGWALNIFDISSEALAPFRQAGADISIARGLEDVGADADLVITMLPSGTEVRQVMLGDGAGGGVVHGMKPGSLVVDMSSSYPLQTRQLGTDLSARDIGLIDAPVSGGVPRAESGTLTIMAGGEKELVDRAEPALAAMGTVYRTGPLGSGHAMKVLNNYLSASGLAAACEAVLVGERFGLDPDVMADILNTSTGRNNATDLKLKQHVNNRRFATGFALGLMSKDVAMAHKLARDLDVNAPGLRTIDEVYQRALVQLGTSSDHSEIFSYLEATSGKSPND